MVEATFVATRRVGRVLGAAENPPAGATSAKPARRRSSAEPARRRSSAEPARRRSQLTCTRGGARRAWLHACIGGEAQRASAARRQPAALSWIRVGRSISNSAPVQWGAPGVLESRGCSIKTAMRAGVPPGARPRLWLALWTAPPETVKIESVVSCAGVPTEHDGRRGYDRGERESKEDE